MLKTGEWLSLSIIGLVIIFIILTISFFAFLIGPDSKGPQTTIEPSSSFIQIIFISMLCNVIKEHLSPGEKIQAIPLAVTSYFKCFFAECNGKVFY